TAAPPSPTRADAGLPPSSWPAPTPSVVELHDAVASSDSPPAQDLPRTPGGLPRRVGAGPGSPTDAAASSSPPPSTSPAEPGRTAGGLSRRVPGAQLPTTEPATMARSEEAEQDRSRPGGDVASFLSSFGGRPSAPARNGDHAEEDR